MKTHVKIIGLAKSIHQSRIDFFLSHLDPDLRLHVEEMDLDLVLKSWMETIQSNWPELIQAFDGFLSYLAARVPRTSPTVFLSRLHVADLYLAYRTAHGDEKAIATFKARYLPEIDSALARLKVPSTTVEEVKGILLEQLFVCSAEVHPVITNYSGLGHLRGWLRVIATRTAQSITKKKILEVPLEEDELLIPFISHDPEKVLVKQTYRQQFLNALKEALQLLSPRQRAILRYHYVDGVGLDRIAQLYKVHRVSVSRWLAQARTQIQSHLRKSLMKELCLTPSDCDSMLQLFKSQLDFSLSRLLRDEES
jgi:RNA polymerase sigma-70 factor, ECF subfamily